LPLRSQCNGCGGYGTCARERVQAAIAAGYERALATILDSNVTTFIVGLSLLMVPGAVRGFAVVHCLGILTSMFSAVMVSRAMVNLLYGHRRRLARLAIGNTAWK
jgi:preprotein translocase subunit SecD